VLRDRVLQRLASRRGEDDGFTLIELVVAMLVISLVLLGLMAAQTSALVTGAQARQRTQAAAVANQTMEQLRALPWLTLSKGLHANFVSAAGGDVNVASGRLQPAVGSTISEPLVTSSAQVTNMPPLSGAAGTNKTVSTDPGGTGTTFTTRTYVTTSPSTASGVLTLTVITTWPAKSNARNAYVMLRSQAYAPAGGCGDVSNQPFLGACQALFSGSGGATAPSVVVSPVTPGPGAPAPTSLLAGTDYAVATLAVGQAGASLTSQQSTSVDSTVQHAASTLTRVDPEAPETASGGTKLNNAASNDVGSAGAAPSSPADVVGTGTSSTVTATGGSLSLLLQAGTGASGTAGASTTTSCRSGVPAGQPCGSGDLSGGTASTVTLRAGTTSFVAASIGTGGASKAFSARFSSAPGTSSVGCTTLSGAGCAAGGASHTVGTTVLGGGPWTGATTGLVKVSSYSDSVLVQRGDAQKATAATASRSATISYWNGTGYATLAVTRATDQVLTVPAVTWTDGTRTVTASARVTVTKSADLAVASDPAGCTGDGCTLDSDTGTITVAVTYTVTEGAVQQALSVVTDLGSSRASAAYKAAPSA
jgi:prepilin-type N-terminal cleavage/methylation domain-containing protein